MEGWISLHRKIEGWEWYDDANTFRLFIHLLLKANHKPQKWRGVPVSRGQLVTSRQRLSEELKISQQSIRTSLTRLKSTSEITIKTTSKYTLITISNYCEYQPTNQRSNQQLTSDQPASNQQVTTNNNVNNDNNKTNMHSWLPEESWKGFKEMRYKLKKPMTERAENMLIRKLEGFRAKGHDVGSILDESTKRCWTDVYEPKTNAAPAKQKQQYTDDQLTGIWR